MREKTIAVFVSFILLFSTTVFAETKTAPMVNATGAVLMEMETGRILFEKNAHGALSMASTTKIMTALLAIESGKLDETVIVSKRAASAPEVSMNLKTGEKHRLEDLLYPLMLESANDAAIAIAEHIGGSVLQFGILMTERAKEIGALDTVFVTPNGLDSGNHHSTAYDMALITRCALQNEKFCKIISTRNISIPINGGTEKRYDITNKNRLLNEFEGAIGVKTGFTGKAGHCFVGAAKRNDMTLISVVLASGWGNVGKEQKWRDTKSLLKYGFENYAMYDIAKKGLCLGDIPVLHSKEEKINVFLAEDIRLPLTRKEEVGLKMNAYISGTVDAPVRCNEKVGYVICELDNGTKLWKSDILAKDAVARHDLKTSMKKLIKYWINPEEKGIL